MNTPKWAISKTRSQRNRMPILMLAAVVLSVATSYFSGVGISYLLPVLALVILAGWISGRRFAVDTAVAAVMRGIAFAAAIPYNSDVTKNGTALETMISLLGLVCTIEIAVRVWTVQQDTRREQGAIWFFSGITLMSGSIDPMDHRIPWIAAVYIALVLGSTVKIQDFTDNAIAKGLRIRITAISLTVAAGAVFCLALQTYESQLYSLGSRLLPNGTSGSSSGGVDGIDKDGHLSSTFNNYGNESRMLILEHYGGDPHLRVMSFVNLSGDWWSPNLSERHFEPVSLHSLCPTALGSMTTVTKLVNDDGAIAAPIDAAGITASGSLSVDREIGDPLRTDESSPYQYEIISNANTSTRPLSLTPDALSLNQYLLIPPNLDPRIIDLTRHLVKPNSTVEVRINAVVTYLQLHNQYSTQFSNRGRDYLSDFIVSHAPGHCEYFATAAAIMLRILSVPSRYVIGYYAHEVDKRGRTIVRAQDAHAWTEVWVKSRGWVVVDATPSNGRPDALAFQPNIWTQLNDRVSDTVLAARFWIASVAESKRNVLLMVALVLAVGVLGFNYFRARRNLLSLSDGNYDADFRKTAVSFEEWLKQQGFQCPVGTTWRVYWNDILGIESQRFAAVAPRVERFISDYEDARYSGKRDHTVLLHLNEQIRDLATMELPRRGNT